MITYYHTWITYMLYFRQEWVIYRENHIWFSRLSRSLFHSYYEIKWVKKKLYVYRQTYTFNHHDQTPILRLGHFRSLYAFSSFILGTFLFSVNTNNWWEIVKRSTNFFLSCFPPQVSNFPTHKEKEWKREKKVCV